MNKLGLKLELKKTKIIKFKEGSRKEKITEIKIKRKKYIIAKKETKLLGIMFHKKLNFEMQINEVKEKIMKANNLLKYINKVGKGMEINTAEIIYKSLIIL